MNNYPSYSVAIRTLGTSGEKYQETLNSVARQTVKPENVFVYIPYGYELPKETIGVEKYIRCDKGMVTQRSQPFDEITSEFILFLDDDLSFQPNFVSTLFDGLIEKKGDCISPDIYRIHKDSLLIKIRNFLGGTRPHFFRNRASIIRRDSHYSYNPHPQKPVLETESAAGACILCRKSVYKNIHFEDERWLDEVKFAFGEDQLFCYKTYKYGYRTLMSYNAEIIHLNARSSHRDQDRMDYSISFGRYVLWYRTIFQPRENRLDKMLAVIARLFSFINSFPLIVGMCLKSKRNRFKIIHNAIKDAKSFVSSPKYSSVPVFLAHKKSI